jgi:hypothetical protein
MWAAHNILNIFSVPCMYVYEIIYYIKLHVEKFEQNGAIRNHKTCQNVNISVLFCRTNAFKSGVMNMEHKLYNMLSNERSGKKCGNMKREIRSYK